MSDTSQRPFSTRTRVSLAIARGIAAGRGDGDLTAAHVLLGLLKEGKNPAVAVMQRADVPVALLAQELEAELGPQGRPVPRQVVLDSTQGEAALVRKADHTADKRGDSYVGTEHLLLAILSDEESPASRVLARHALSRSEGRLHIDAVTGRGGPPQGGRSEQPEGSVR